MSDVNVKITMVDKGLEIINVFSLEIQDIKAHVLFDLNSLIDLIEREKMLVRIQYENYNLSSDSLDDNSNTENQLNKTMDRYRQLELLLHQTTVKKDELSMDLTSIFKQIMEKAESCNFAMGEYIRKLNLINGNHYVNYNNVNRKTPDYYVVIVDSKKYPQTAEHIKMAQTMGLPEFVTIGRLNAAKRRKASLENIRIRQIYDRDEWPMAVFEEGGTGANVVYLNGQDNRGAGSSISWQMRGLPDGSRVRVRVI